MKRVVYISKSKLSRNLMEIMMPAVPKKISFTGLDSLDEAGAAFFPKPVQLLILDDNALDGRDAETAQRLIGANAALKGARKLLFCRKDSPLDRESFARHGFSQAHIKPFLPEELAALIDKNLGHKR